MTIGGRPLRALVVEDEWPARNYLVRLLQGSSMAEVVGALATAAEGCAALEATPPGAIDVAFMDIELARGGGKTEGLALVRRFALMPHAPAFVLATAFPEHAAAAFEIGVVDYLVKPFTEERVAQCLRRVIARRAPAPIETAPARIVARRKRSLVLLGSDEIWAFEAAERLTFAHARAGRLDVDLSLSAIEASFGRAFLRVHRNWLVNADCVREIAFDAGERALFVGGHLDDPSGVRVPVARERATAVRERLVAGG